MSAFDTVTSGSAAHSRSRRRAFRTLGAALATGTLVMAALFSGTTPATAAPLPSIGEGPTIGGTPFLVDVDGLEFTDVAAGTDFSLGLTADGDVYSWGRNQFGQLGDGTTTSSSVPVLVSGGHSFTSISAGAYHAVALTASGTAYSWGYNSFGELGNGTTTNSSTPLLVSGGHTFASVSAGAYFTVAVDNMDNVYGWGQNSSGQLGNGTFVDASVPTSSMAASIASLAAGANHVLALSKSGAVSAWGANSEGQLGDTVLISRPFPMVVAGIDTATHISAKGNHSLAVTTGGTAYAWGENDQGQLGTGNTTNALIPTPVSGGHSFDTIAAGDKYSIALTAAGTAYAWGENDQGQLGTGNTTNALIPTAVSGGHTFDVIAAGAAHTLAIASNGAPYGWGGNTYGQVGDGTSASRTAPVALDVPEVYFGNVPADDVHWNDDLKLVFSSPAVPVGGTVTVSIEGEDIGTFTYGLEPAIAVDPVELTTKTPGATASFSAVADGDEAPSASWQRATPPSAGTCDDVSDSAWTTITPGKGSSIKTTAHATTEDELGYTETTLTVTSPNLPGDYCFRAVFANGVGNEGDGPVPSYAATLRVTPEPVVLSKSTITASAPSVTADGRHSATITVRLFNAQGKGVAGHDVTLSTDLGDLSDVTDNGDGTYTATLSSTETGVATVVYAVGDQAGPGEAVVTFVAPGTLADTGGPAAPIGLLAAALVAAGTVLTRRATRH